MVIKFIAIDTKTPSTGGLVTKSYPVSDKEDIEKKIEYVDKKIPNTTQKLQILKIRYLSLLV